MKTEKRMFISFILNFLFTIFEFIGGILTNSVALLSDSVHDLGDSISMGVAIFLEKKSKQKADYKYTYGYYRFSLLGGLVTSVILVFGSGIIIFEAIKRILNPEPIQAEMMIYFAIVGVIINGLAALNASKGKSLNEKAISLHLFEDVFGWVALLIAAIVIKQTNFYILDAILSIAFTIFIATHVFKNLKKILEVFLEKAPEGLSIEEIKTRLLENKGIQNIHHVHLWTIEGSIPIITLHAKLIREISVDKVSEVTQWIKATLKQLGITHSTIQIEFFNDDCDKVDCDNLEVKETNHHH